MMAETVKTPEQFSLGTAEHVPNNLMPALVYRDVLPKPYDRGTAKQLCEGNYWEMRGEWGEIKTPHFHPNTHECYAIIQGSSRLILGRSVDNSDPSGVEVDVRAGDVVVVPAGVSHRSLSSEDGYRYIGVYPRAAPKWRNNWCKGDEPLDGLREEIANVGFPEADPVYGSQGPLMRIWSKATQ